jgi:hypothetical protein
VTDDVVGVKGWLKKCSAVTNTRDVWVAIGVVFLVLGFMGKTTAYLAVGAVFLVIGFVRGR